MTHEHEYEHVHYDELGNEIIEEHRHSLYKADRRELRSVGIDIGSTTSHLIFSQLVLRRQSAALSSRFEVAERRVAYASPIMITPFTGGLRSTPSVSPRSSSGPTRSAAPVPRRWIPAR